MLGAGVHIRDGDVSVSDDGRIAIVIRSAKGEVETDELTGDERVVVFCAGRWRRTCGCGDFSCSFWQFVFSLRLQQ